MAKKKTIFGATELTQDSVSPKPRKPLKTKYKLVRVREEDYRRLEDIAEAMSMSRASLASGIFGLYSTIYDRMKAGDRLIVKSIDDMDTLISNPLTTFASSPRAHTTPVPAPTINAAAAKKPKHTVKKKI